MGLSMLFKIRDHVIAALDQQFNSESPKRISFRDAVGSVYENDKDQYQFRTNDKGTTWVIMDIHARPYVHGSVMGALSVNKHNWTVLVRVGVYFQPSQSQPQLYDDPQVRFQFWTPNHVSSISYAVDGQRAAIRNNDFEWFSSVQPTPYGRPGAKTGNLEGASIQSLLFERTNEYLEAMEPHRDSWTQPDNNPTWMAAWEALDKLVDMLHK